MSSNGDRTESQFVRARLPAVLFGVSFVCFVYFVVQLNRYGSRAKIWRMTSSMGTSWMSMSLHGQFVQERLADGDDAVALDLEA